MKILHILPSVDPKGGGPMEGVRQRGLRLIEMGHEVEVLSLDDPASFFLPGYGLTVHALGPSRGGYRYNPRLVPWLRDHARKYDAIVVNGLWQYHSFGAWRALNRMKVPYFVFTHGMLDPWFKHAYPLKHLKKWLYWPWAEYRVLRDAQTVLFTSEEERLRARESFGLYRAHEAVVTYGTTTPPGNAGLLRAHFYAAHPDLRGKRLLLFMSRIHEKKGCDLLIDAFAKVAGQNTDLHLVMAGPDQTGWAAALQAHAQRLGIAGRITWPGMLQGVMKWGAFYASEAFVLPSHQENFGIAVAEALGCGVPVLISDKVNIWREIEADGAGIVNSDTADGTEKSLRQWLALDAADRSKMAQQARTTFERRFTVDAMANSLIETITEHHASKAGEATSNILIFRIGQLGDTLVALPAIEKIRREFPSHRLVLLTNKDQSLANFVSSWDVLGPTGWFDQSIFYNPNARGWGRLKMLVALVARLRALKFEHIFNVAPERSTEQNKRDEWFFRNIIGALNYHAPPSGYGVYLQSTNGGLPRLGPEWQRLLRIVAVAEPGDRGFHLPIPESERASAFGTAHDLGIDFGSMLLAIGPGSKMPAKKWPGERFAELGARLLNEFPKLQILVLGGKEDITLGNELCGLWGERSHNLAGKLSIYGSAALLERCTAYVGNDTGTMHLAAMVGKPCVAIFSARDNPGKWDPYGNGHLVLRREVECAGCMLEVCNHDNKCLKLIGVDEVYLAVRTYIDPAVGGAGSDRMGFQAATPDIAVGDCG
ncbi:MAG TPA: glycosyltransferase [Gallionella sp.]|nr:glycosyltransferase [Gallionella sp.]